MDIKKFITEKLNINAKYYQKSCDFFNVQMIKEDFLENEKSIFVVLPNLFLTQKYYDLLSLILKEDDVLFFPSDQILTNLMALGSPEFKNERLNTISKLLTNKKYIVVTNIDALTMCLKSPESFLKNTLKLTKGESYEVDLIIKYLIANGYNRSYIVENPGYFSIRGGIIDIFLNNNENPIRLDFFGDLLENIKIFDVEKQTSFKEINETELSPFSELFFDENEKNAAILKIKKHFSNKKLSEIETSKLKKDLDLIENREKLANLNMYIPFFEDKKFSILDFKTEKKLYVIEEHLMLQNEIKKKDDLKTYKNVMSGNAFLSIDFQIDYQSLISKGNVNIDNNGILHKDGVLLNVFETNKYKDNLSLFYFELKNTYENFKIYFSNKMNDANRFKLIDFLSKNDFYDYDFFDFKIGGSFFIEEKMEVYFDETSIFGVNKNVGSNYRSVLNAAKKIESKDELNVGDYVVHYDFGVARYLGIKTMNLSEFKRDYLYLEYKDNDFLYVPVEQIELILKYGDIEGATPILSKLGTNKWQRTKLEIKKKIKDLSERLLKIYANRKNSTGISFSDDSSMQLEFEKDFEYELTEDQKKCIIATKAAMMSSSAMDMLIVGDVGFGKTEVALRAAFKAVLDGYQVLYLCPTTILARQHYYTFKKRFEKFGANVALLSRFVSKNIQKETILNLKNGLIDVVVGTHRLLSKDVEFNKLGLLIVDEEQRFGVMHKEKIKEIKENVDTLTLSATPIPRTLQMALLGLKNLETIKTAPINRYPIQTYVLKRNDAIIKDALLREVARGGQVFYLYNKVSDIESIVEKLKKLVPNLRINFAHGQMNKDLLEKRISNFIDQEFDVLVSTTIIETGIDIPNVNTLIIHDAEMLGMSQLYQIRGRVGRSNKIAYAYLMYDEKKIISFDAMKRLKTLEDFSQLNSGYKIALRDLSIRGAGDILGSEQSGFINSVGLEMYLQLLDEVIKGKEEIKVNVDQSEIYSDRSINDEYIKSDAVKIEIHKKINKINDINSLNKLKRELEDRFGKFDFKLLIYMHEMLLKKFFKKIGVYKEIHLKEEMIFFIKKDKSLIVDGNKLFEVAGNFKYKVKLGYVKEEIKIQINYAKANENWIYIANCFFEEYFYN